MSEGTEQVGEIRATFPHPRYDEDTVDFDYAVIRLSTPLALNENVKAIELTTTEALSGDCISSGWGTTSTTNTPERLQHVTIPIVPRAQCEESYVHSLWNITSRMICAGGDGTGPCTGDSGGPLVCDGRLAGLTSWGTFPCGQLKYPGVYANVAPAVNWIGLQ